MLDLPTSLGNNLANYYFGKCVQEFEMIVSD